MQEKDDHNSAKRYQAVKIRLYIVELAAMFIYLLFFQLSGLSHAVKEFIRQFFKSQPAVIGGYLLIFGAIYYAAAFPLKYYKGNILERRYRLSNQTGLAWLKDEAKGIIISSVIFIGFVEIFYFLLKTTGRYWWLWMAAASFLFSVVFTRIFPTLILPLFYKFKKIDNEAIRQALVDLAKRCGVSLLDVFQIDFSAKTKKANAALVGLGKTKRVIIADTLLSGYTQGEIKSVAAHEFGHYRLRHIWKLIFFGAIANITNFLLVALSADHLIKILRLHDISDIEAFPAICLIMAGLGLAAMPIHNGYSRRLEREADLFALRHTQDKDSFISCMNKLAANNLSDTAPNKLVEFLLCDHPPISKRIEFARGFIK